jgi:cytochrome oxidase Cu insertion factor (SCO1/SenC/PrrC family)
VSGRRRWALGLFVLAGLAAGGIGGWAVLTGQPGALWDRGRTRPGDGTLETLGAYGEVPDFTLTERTGQPVARRDLLGRVWLANFVYTHCTETCPLQSAVLARLQAEVPAPDFRLVSITVDPTRDTPAVLARYAERYGADPGRWWFLTGDKRAIYRLAKDGFRLGVVDPDDPTASAWPLVGAASAWPLVGAAPAWAAHGAGGLVMHSPRLVLVDRQARIRAYHRPDDEASLARLRRNLGRLLREGA